MEKIYNIMTNTKSSALKTSSALLILFLAIALCSCGSMRAPIVKTYDDSITNYRYFCITPTGNYTSNGGTNWMSSGSSIGKIKSINPANTIAGILFKNGYIQVNEVNPDNAKETMIVNFGETGRRNINLGYSIEVTIQFVSAYSQQPICICTAEGQGETEADDVRKAIHRALEPLFKKKK